MIIVCDIDGVLNDLVNKTLTLYNKRHNKHINIDDIIAYKFSDCLSPEDADGICELFKEKELWDSLEPLPYSQKGLKVLIDKGHEIYLATATHPVNFPWKVEWIKYHFPFINSDNILCIKNKGLLTCDVMIDDCLDNLIGNICERVVVDAPWNRSTSKDFSYDIHRATNWHDVINIIDDIERKNREWVNQ